MLDYYTKINRIKSLQKGKLVFQTNAVDKIWIVMSILLITFFFAFGCLMIYDFYSKGNYGWIVPLFIFLVLPFFGMLMPSRLKKIEFSRRNKSLIVKYFLDKNYIFLVKKGSVLIVHPRHRTLSLHTPTTIAIVYDRKDTYINCSTFYPMYRIYVKMRFLPFFFLDRKHERRIAKELNDYIASYPA
jgi:hypothetical protein